jgi:hypothetical protein
VAKDTTEAAVAGDGVSPSPDPPVEPIPTDGAAPERISARQRDLLCALAYVYLACGQQDKALPLIRVVDSFMPDDVGTLRVLAYTLLAHGKGEETLAALDRLVTLDDGDQARVAILLLRSHALRLAGRMDEARVCFQRFVAARGGPLIEDGT